MSRHVPYLAEEAIERDAAALLAEFEHARGREAAINAATRVKTFALQQLQRRASLPDQETKT